ncbi:DUF456 domain-containing protein [Tellurirhabdus rosea]|uniref:DUF456 domain-containing protein n=1 Tax=Tellurirhabdus rosea TaxID=2674997 RepID=UPI002256CD7A|nr:DUF456 domain-containing protein [Tellurirhabdus rosea]
MDQLLLLLGIAGLLIGLAGAVLPLPGPPLSYAGLLCLHFSNYAEFSTATLVSLGLATAVIAVADYYVPIWGTKKFGGTAAGQWGSMIGLCVGFFVIPGIGIFLGAFLGAFIGELIAGAPSGQAMRAAFGSFVGFLAGIVMKVILCLVMIVVAGVELWDYFY